MNSPSAHRIKLGKPYPLGATWNGEGVNFAVYSQHSSALELCLFESGAHEEHRIFFHERTDHVWHMELTDVNPGQLYGYRAHGPYDPPNGHRFNHNKLLLDPYARQIARDLTWDDALFGYKIGADDLSYDERDSSISAPLAEVVDPAFTWGDDRPPCVPWSKTLIYELHVRGFTKRMPGVPELLRGTYAGLASEAAISHLKSLNVTAVELLPVHFRVNDRHLLERGLSNYWGYNTLGFFAPDPRFASQPQRAVAEFQTMVRRLHAAGIEVILDVVFNHSGEGSELGPTLSFRGLDNATYYRLSTEAPRHTHDYTGCGNTLNLDHARTLQLITDSLRYWVKEMHVDGFRFDLTATLGREPHDFTPGAAFFDVVLQDPVLSQVKLIAEPWDVGPGGYQVGNFPPPWSEWNAEYRDTVRRFWAGAAETAPQFASRLSGSSDLYERNGRRPSAGINFITCHDGFTLSDLVSYNGKHNEANGEENRDGANDNHSWNCGAEGPTDDPNIRALRAKQQRNLLATLLLSQGVPMLLAGDEFGHSQAGNNNAYCQDNELTWLNWDLSPEQQSLLEFVRKVSKFRRDQPALRRSRFFRGVPLPDSTMKEATWIRPDGGEMTDEDWSKPVKALGLQLAGPLAEDPQQPPADTLLLLFNMGDKAIRFQMPLSPADQRWELKMNTADDKSPQRLRAGGERCTLHDHNVKIYRLRVVIPKHTGELHNLAAVQS